MSDYIRKRGNRYYPMIYLGYIGGKRKYKSGGGFDKRSEAKEELLKMQNKIKKNSIMIEADDMTFGELAEQWYEMHAKPTISYRALENYKGILNKSLVPAFGNVKLKTIQPIHIQRYLMTLKHLSPATIRKYFYVLKSIMDKGVEWKILEISPIKGITLPSLTTQEFTVWDNVQINKFLNIVKDTKWYVPFLLAFTTGMRQGEICGLKWSDYNTITGDISVSRSMQRNFKLKDTKTKSSRRKIVLLKKTKLALDYQKRCQEENENLLGKQYINSGFICTHNNGESINPENLGKTFKKLIKEYKLEPIRFHDIRHSFATILLQNGTNPKIVSEILGHSDVQTTLNVYSHVLPDLQKDTMQQLEGILF
ncbi:site-specific integrase [Cellulosilyticum lentocellum]|uniref:Integrase family protein n=1 Tax=Cellulosilyticum lentocellum (strain ATCC 49066 / DSM 5427 / NCIMB 11756 / RHM5) TaxID=642492 RepID=F2JN92_CELLD|nr:tyrosine-type recombinase/integrase [Cellulosilyticum lentocellum]ADZ83546.1 integrase family protein [Cellulosilyticum lentocellum DSM 5427]